VPGLGIEVTLHGVQFDAIPMEYEGEDGLLLSFRDPQSGITISIPATLGEAAGWAGRVLDMPDVKVNCDSCGEDFAVTTSGPVAYLTCPHCGHKLLEGKEQTDEGDPLDLVE
jgi:DNA-directed RNA polymerase subunit RPC12/RpoP